MSQHQQMNRRDLLSLAALAGAGLALGPVGRTFGQAAGGERKKVLFFSAGCGHEEAGTALEKLNPEPE